MSGSNTFTKAERLCSQTAIDWLFDGKGHSFSVFPLRVIFKAVPVEAEGAIPASVLPKLLLSVPKRKFHHAVDRNRVKRLLREAYRKQKHTLVAFTTEHHLSLAMAFVYMTDEPATAAGIEERVSTALSRIVRTLKHESAD